MSEIPEHMFEHDDRWPGGMISFMRPKDPIHINNAAIKEGRKGKGYRHNLTALDKAGACPTCGKCYTCGR